MEAKSASMDRTSTDIQLSALTNNGNDGSVNLQVGLINDFMFKCPAQ